jgi:hypothetical protein
VFRLAIELPFDVLIVHKKTFKTEETASKFLHRHYKRFPAVEIRTAADVDAWAGTVFMFPAHWKRKR